MIVSFLVSITRLWAFMTFIIKSYDSLPMETREESSTAQATETTTGFVTITTETSGTLTPEPTMTSSSTLATTSTSSSTMTTTTAKTLTTLATTGATTAEITAEATAWMTTGTAESTEVSTTAASKDFETSEIVIISIFSGSVSKYQESENFYVDRKLICYQIKLPRSRSRFDYFKLDISFWISFLLCIFMGNYKTKAIMDNYINYNGYYCG